MNFLDDLFSPEFPFLRNAILFGWIIAVPVGTIGATVVARRISYLVAAIAHASIGGIGAAIFLADKFHLPWLTPPIGAFFATQIAALVLAHLTATGRDREDTLIGAVWTTGMAAGILFIANSQTYTDPSMWLFGDILLLSSGDLLIAAIASTGLSIAMIKGSSAIKQVCFDEDFARLKGIRVRRTVWLILAATGCLVSLLSALVGVLLVIALVTLPPSIAGRFASSLKEMMILGSVISAGLVTAGISLSYAVDMPSGPTVALLGCAVYTLSLLKQNSV